MKFRGSTILLTGAAGFVGSGLAQSFLDRGATLLLSGRDESALSQLARRFDPAGEKCKCYAADLCRVDSIEKMVRAIEAAGQKVDILINNAADTTSLPFGETSLERIEGIIRTNLIGTLQLTRLIVPGMVARRTGAIVNISSLAGYKPDASQTVYSISKGGMNAVSEALNAELRSSGVRVLNVALMGVGVGPRKVPIEVLAQRIERAVERGDRELFLYRRTQWLMRLYGACPWLKHRVSRS